MIQSDPAMENVGIVIFDEFHERSIHADLGLAMLLDAKEVFCPKLKIAVMSATLNTERLLKLLPGAETVDSEGRCFPVSVLYAPGKSSQSIEEQTSLAVYSALQSFPGDVLVFLPGEGEIHRTASVLEPLLKKSSQNHGWKAEIFPLYGSLPPGEQDKAIRGGRIRSENTRRIILSTSLAETSVTVEGVRIVVDSGWMRVPRFSPSNGMNRLETIRVSKASAEQRRGRAGRVEEGVCIRLWSQLQQSMLTDYPTPEILESDLTSLVLELSAWGETEKTIPNMKWMDIPPEAAVSQAFRVLRSLDGLGQDGRLTPRGRKMLGFPLHPRLSHAILICSGKGWGPQAALLA